MAAPLPSLRAGRIAAIDALRGLTFVAMVFVNEVAGVSGISPWLKHMPADADAMSFADLVFPAFLFIVGMSIPFSINARIAKGDGAWALQRHIGARALALIVMGVFMVNAEGGFNAQAMPMPIALWSLLFYLAAYLVWGALPWTHPAAVRATRGAGVALLLLLAATYRAGAQGEGGMTPQWWGILGLIGWAYFYCSELYLLVRGRLGGVLLVVGLMVGYYALAQRAELPPSVRWIFSQDAHAAHSQIVLAGVACALVFFGGAGAAGELSHGRRIRGAVLLAAGLAVAATVAWQWFPISKILATPSWCLYSASLSVLAFCGLYWLMEVRRRDRWARWVEPAASNPLVTYLLPFVVVQAMSLAGLEWPAALRHGFMGLAWAAAYAVIVVCAVAWLNRRGVRFQL